MDPLHIRRCGSRRGRLLIHVRGILLMAALAALPVLSAHAGAAGNSASRFHLPRSPLSGGVLMARAIHAGQVQPIGAPAGSTSLSSTPTCAPTPCALPNVQASPAQGTQPVDEDPIAANPLNAQDLLTGGNDFNCNSVLGFYASSDGGSTWNHTCMTGPTADLVGCGDPGVGYDLTGAAYITGIFSPNTSCFPSVIAFEKSTDNGQKWNAPAVAVTPLFSGGLTDKPWLQVDDNAGSPHAGALYISVTQFDASGNDTEVSVSHSTNGGATWTTSAVDTVQVFPQETDQFSDLAISKDGTVYVSWLRCPGGCAGAQSPLLLSKSTDGGNTWSAPVTIATPTLAPDQSSCCFFGQLPNTMERVSEIPVIGIDNSSGAHASTVYAAFYTWTGSAMKVEVVTSTTGGSSWGTPVLVGPPADPGDQFFPWLSVSSGGLVGVTWLDRRYDPDNISYEAFAAISSDGGATFPNLQIAPVASNPNNDGFSGTFMGDYTGNIWDSTGTILYGSWMDTRNGTNTQDEVGGRIGAGSVPAWNNVSNPNVPPGSILRGVAAVSASDVWAVGDNGGGSSAKTLTEQWNGTSWTVIPSPNRGAAVSAPAGVAAVSNPPATPTPRGSATVNAPNGEAAAKHTPTPTPTLTPTGTSFSALNGVAAISASDIWAVGNAGTSSTSGTSGTNLTLAEHWNGTNWSIVTSPNVGTSFNTLFAVAADTTADVWAVGDFQTSSGTQTLIEHWNGTSWSVVPSPNVGTGSNQLNAVVALSPSDAWAAGFSVNASGQEQTLILHWNGTSWSVVSSPNVGTFTNELDAMAAVSATDIWAVGTVQVNGGTLTLAEHWNGTSWSVVSSANGSTISGSSNDLESLAIVSGTDIWAAGFTTAASGNLATLIEQWNGSSWAVVPSVSNGTGQSRFLGVATVTATDAWAVGVTAQIEQYCC